MRPPRVRDASRCSPRGPRGVFTWPMADLAFVLLTIGVFAILALVVKGMEKL